MFSRSWQQEKWSHGNSFHPDASFVNPNIRPFISPSSSWHRSELALARAHTLEVTWETGSVHVMSDSESGAAGLSWHKLASKHSFMRFTTEANRSNIYWGPCSNWKQRRVWWKSPTSSVMCMYSSSTAHTAHRLLCIPLSEPSLSDACTRFLNLLSRVATCWIRSTSICLVKTLRFLVCWGVFEPASVCLTATWTRNGLSLVLITLHFWHFLGKQVMEFGSERTTN